MKRSILLKVFIIVLLFIPTCVFAEGFTVKLNGTESASTNEKIDYTLSLKSDSQAVGFEATVKYDTNILELVSILKEDEWIGANTLQNNGNNTLKFTNKGVTGESSVFTLKFLVKSAEKNSTTISFESMKLYVTSEEEGQDNTVLPTDDKKIDISIKSDDNTLRTIKIDDKVISGFNSGVFEYTLEVDSTKEEVKLDAVLNDKNSASFEKDFGSRTVKLEYGENLVEIKTKSDSGKQAVYKLNIIRKDDREVNNDLKSILLNSGKVKIDFHKSTLTYTVHTYKLEKLDVAVEVDDPTSKYKIDCPEKLVIGDNKVVITVTSQTGKEKQYTILVVNSEVPTDTRLKNLSVKGINIGFNSDKYKYTVRYDKSYKDGVVIYETTYSNNVEVKIEGNQRIKENGVVKVIINAIDGSSSSEYTITFEKDRRVNFFLILDVIIGIVLIALISVQVKIRSKKKKALKEAKKEEELSKTKEITL